MATKLRKLETGSVEVPMSRNMVFLSYAHEDERWKHRISTQLRVLQQQSLLKLWCDLI
jgi:hypothetical protein